MTNNEGWNLKKDPFYWKEQVAKASKNERPKIGFLQRNNCKKLNCSQVDLSIPGEREFTHMSGGIYF